jgi:transcriptional regulatory protein LevR
MEAVDRGHVADLERQDVDQSLAGSGDRLLEQAPFEDVDLPRRVRARIVARSLTEMAADPDQNAGVL